MWFFAYLMHDKASLLKTIFREKLMDEQSEKKRIASIDAVRGFDMFWIIGGDLIFRSLFTLIGTNWANHLSEQLEHCTWHGFHFYDLIFPLFLFIMGASMPFSISKRLERGDSRRKLMGHIIQRGFILILLGLMYNGLFELDFENMRYAGVLQRIGITYMFAAFIIMQWKNPKIQMIIGGGILLLYWAVMAIPVPGAGSYVLTPEGNLASYIDRLLLPGRFCCFRFGDNEGILSTFPAIVNVLMGIQAGHLLKSTKSDPRKVLILTLSGAGCVTAALIWNFVFPINKLIWTSSYVLFSGGWSLLLLALFYWVIDVKGWKKWAFGFIVIGMNPITIYLAQNIIHFQWIANYFTGGLVELLGAFKPLVWEICVFAVKWLFLYLLFRKQIFLKV
jgi:predicted acyltransferase